MKDLLKRELKIWIQYFLITCIAAVVGHYAWESAQDVSRLSGPEGSQVAVNVREMIIALWRDYYRWVLGAFVGLSAVRILIVLVMNRGKQGMA